MRHPRSSMTFTKPYSNSRLEDHHKLQRISSPELLLHSNEPPSPLSKPMTKSLQAQVNVNDEHLHPYRHLLNPYPDQDLRQLANYPIDLRLHLTYHPVLVIPSSHNSGGSRPRSSDTIPTIQMKTTEGSMELATRRLRRNSGGFRRRRNVRLPSGGLERPKRRGR